MSLLDIFNSAAPSSDEYPPQPQDAPLRPGYKAVLAIPLLSLAFLFVAFMARECGFPPFFTVISTVGVISSWIWPVVLWRRYERIGWYKKYEVVRPDLPFEIRPLLKRITLGEDAITWSGWLTQDFTIRYDQILEVETRCEEDCLTGVRIWYARQPSGRKGDVNPTRDTKFISDGAEWVQTNGERTRNVIAILRDKAPHATFSGPQWVEAGWVPRQGFAEPKSSYSGYSGFSGGP